MSTIQMALSIVGGMLIPISIYGLRKKPASTTESEWQMPPCAMPSPDQSLRCKQELGHLGWHQGGTKSWFGACWFEEQEVATRRVGEQSPAYPDIIGPAPIKVRVGMFGTRRTLPNDQDRKSA